MEGAQLFQSLDRMVPSEYVAVTIEQWQPTPYMVDVYTDGRIVEIRNWCFQSLGSESSPMHGQLGIWRQSYVTMSGRSWFGFSSEAIMNKFTERFPDIH